MTQKLSWRCATKNQQRDKAEIYNSREWKALRIEKLRANPICEMCEKERVVRSSRCVHHIIPIETAKTKQHMRELAFNPNNLMSLCFECHAKIHKQLGSNTKKIVAERSEARQQRWKDGLMQRFTTATDDEPKTPGVPV